MFRTPIFRMNVVRLCVLKGPDSFIRAYLSGPFREWLTAMQRTGYAQLARREQYPENPSSRGHRYWLVEVVAKRLEGPERNPPLARGPANVERSLRLVPVEATGSIPRTATRSAGPAGRRVDRWDQRSYLTHLLSRILTRLGKPGGESDTGTPHEGSRESSDVERSDKIAEAKAELSRSAEVLARLASDPISNRLRGYGGDEYTER